MECAVNKNCVVLGAIVEMCQIMPQTEEGLFWTLRWGRLHRRDGIWVETWMTSSISWNGKGRRAFHNERAVWIKTERHRRTLQEVLKSAGLYRRNLCVPHWEAFISFVTHLHVSKDRSSGRTEIEMMIFPYVKVCCESKNMSHVCSCLIWAFGCLNHWKIRNKSVFSDIIFNKF